MSGTKKDPTSLSSSASAKEHHGLATTEIIDIDESKNKKPIAESMLGKN